jgi:hypothetical protein
MTNQDQVSLDEMARQIVEWMDGWEMLDNYHVTHKEKSKFAITVKDLKTSLDVIRVVEEAIKNEGIKSRYGIELRKQSGSYVVTDTGGKQTKNYGLATADPKTRLRAIYRTLRESGEI